MPTASFTKQKAKGREFETRMMNVCRQVGSHVVDLDKQSYKVKAQGDFIVKVPKNGQWYSNFVECKLDQMSETTGNVAIDLDSINKSNPAIWIYGLPASQTIEVYTMFLKDLGPFAQAWRIKRPAGEFGLPVALIPKATFTAQPLVKHFKTIEV
jgi:hypothetical protein